MAIEKIEDFGPGIDKFYHQDILSSDPYKYNIHVVLSTYCPLGCKGCYQTELSQKKVLDKDVAWNKIKETVKFINDVSKKQLTLPFSKTVQKPRINLTFFGGEPILQMTTIIYILTKLRTEMNEDYMTINAICIPTSGFAGNLDHNILLENIDIIAGLVKELKLDCNISISHDGLNNKELRNINPEKVTSLINILQKKSVAHGWNLISDRISLVIPQKFNEDYFIDNYKYIKEGVKLEPSFTIPHTFDKDSTFVKEPEILKKALAKFIGTYKDKFQNWGNGKTVASCCSNDRLYTSTDNELPTLFESLLSKIHEAPYNWCGAGVNHFTIQTDGSYTNCEYINLESEDFLKKVQDHCSNCEIKNYCQKPCIKNFEQGFEESLKNQCQVRKILFNEVKKGLEDNA